MVAAGAASVSIGLLAGGVPAGTAAKHPAAKPLWVGEPYCAGRFPRGGCHNGAWTVAACIGASYALSSFHTNNGKAVRFEVHQGDRGDPLGGDRCELVLRDKRIVGMEPAAIPQRRFFAFDALYGPSMEQPVGTEYQTAGQWHQTTAAPGCGGNSPLRIAITGKPGRKDLKVISSQCTHGSSSRRVLFDTPLVPGRWHRWLFEIRWSPDPNVGYVRITYDGRVVTKGQPGCDPSGGCHLPTRLVGVDPATGAPVIPLIHFKIGNYRGRGIAQPTVVSYRNVRIGMTAASVRPPEPKTKTKTKRRRP
jgi:hypothetical protein